MTEQTARRRYRKLEAETKDGLILIDPAGQRKAHRELVEPPAPAPEPDGEDFGRSGFGQTEEDGQPRLL